MKGKKVKGVPLSNFPLDPKHKLAIAMNKIDWDSLQNSKGLFQQGFEPLQPIRRIFGLLVLEAVRGLEGDELLQQWIEMPVLQYFTGEDLFHWEFPITNKEIAICKAQISRKGIGLLNSMIDDVNKI